MAGKFTDEGENDLATKYFKNGYANLYLLIYLDTTEPPETADLTTITELALTGYARIAIPSADWTVVTDTATAALKTFTAGEDWGNIYGYGIATVATGTAGLLLGIEHFSDGPYNVLDTKTVDVTAVLRAA
jgi:hypothetical protein